MEEKEYARPEVISDFCRSLTPVGRILVDPDHNIWGCAPIYGPDGKVHVFYSRWKNEAGHEGWLTVSEIAHAVADDPEGPYETVDVPVSGRGGDWWDSMTIHNPTIHKVGHQYVLFYMGNSDGTVMTKRVGMATSESLYGPWERCAEPLILPDPDPNAWNSVCTSNPAFLQHPNGEFWLYYKSWRTADWKKDQDTGDWRNSNRQYGLTVSKELKGPYIKQGEGALINLREKVKDAQSEDAYIWYEDGTFKMLMRDMGFWNHEYGLLFESEDGLHWGEPQIAYRDAFRYFDEPATGAWGEGRFERPQLLMKDGKPEYLFGAYRGGKYGTSTGVVLKLN
ncbi:glycoside hydrolase family protein [Pontiella agarivorans]|uniref:Glycoside hydrolase family protein n=1 Tax=Pontiella agarivorans TaxID=3038953 RepID=A0ABU5MTS2_9BACT|nr:glycoside hydrolase family protein [Pontiella agarivorans]MDZ8117523.1 glycoside hydrolase family protein [Pontiella agarivorans]